MEATTATNKDATATDTKKIVCRVDSKVWLGIKAEMLRQFQSDSTERVTEQSAILSVLKAGITSLGSGQ